MKLKRKEISISRECSIKIIYQHLITGDKPLDIYKHFEDKRSYDETALKKFISHYQEHFNKISSTLSKKTNINTDTITTIDCAILYQGIMELVYFRDIPKAVIIDESIKLAKKFSSENAFKFVNTLLDKVGVDIRDEDKK